MSEKQKIAVMFPGQGSQFIGMGKEFLETDPGSAALMEKAESVSGFPVRQLCLEGPMEELTRTVHLQPAITAINLMCRQALEQAGVRPDYFVGHSLGEYSALCAAGVLTPEDTLRLVTERGKLMEREADNNPGGMLAVLGLTLGEVTPVLSDVKNGRVTVANHNSEKQVILSGNAAGLDAASRALSETGAKIIPLKVSGAWHSSLVEGAVPDFTVVMEKTPFHQPGTPVFFNVTAGEEGSPDAIRKIMASQIASMVRWVDIVKELADRGVRVFVEAGPKNVLCGLVKKILPRDYGYKCYQFDTPEKLAACLRDLG